MAYLKKIKDETNLFDSENIPFKIRLDFKKLIDFWEELANDKSNVYNSTAKDILKRLDKAPELREPILDFTLIEKYSEEIKLLFSAIFSPLTSRNEIQAVAIPYAPYWFNLTERMANILENKEDSFLASIHSYDDEMKYIVNCHFYLSAVHGVNFTYKKPMIFNVENGKKKIMKHYRVLINADFAEFKPNEKFQPLSDEDINELMNNFDDIELWKKKIPPHSIDFEGFTIMKLVDVTESEALSQMEFELLKKDALSSPESIDTIKKNLESLLNLSDLKIGFATYDKNIGALKSMGYGFWSSITLSNKKVRKIKEAFCSISYPVLFEKKIPYTIPVVKKELDGKDPIVTQLLANNLQSYIAFPLVYGGEVVGVFELGSKEECLLNSEVAKSMGDVIPILATSLKRSIDEYENQLESIIQEKCTAIHPSVNWRFFEAAENLLNKRRFYDTDEMEEIAFPKVYPLYGQSDIKGSSTARNDGIQADMIEQLNLAKETLGFAIKLSPMPIYDALKLRIENNIDKMKKGLSAGDEITILDFLKKDIYPVFKHLEANDSEMKVIVDKYRSKLDPELGVIYNKRKAYEESVTRINNEMGAYIESAQEEAQKMFPHYFEKYKTDGVEHNMYIGQSIVNTKEFDSLYLKNLRLWQLMVTCEIENKVENLKKELPVPLSVASLILVHSNPITIKFKTEEKQFDVDGAYNVRYEIIKKRIDKAIVNGTGERLTQTKKIAIVYSQDKEAEEYLPLLEYLQSIKYIGPEIEYLNLKDMQGVKGMKALRVSVVYNEVPKKKSREVVKEEVQR